MSSLVFRGVDGTRALFDVEGSGVLVNVRTHSTQEVDLETASVTNLWLAASGGLNVNALGEIASYAIDSTSPGDVQVVVASTNRQRAHTIPKAVMKEALLGLERADRLHGQTAMSLYTGQVLAAGGQISYPKLQHMARFLNVSRYAEQEYRNARDKTAWSLWGGNPGRRWVNSMISRRTLALTADGFLIDPEDLKAFEDEDVILFGLSRPDDPFAIEGLLMVADNSDTMTEPEFKTFVWDAGHWNEFDDKTQLEEWAPRLVELDEETAMNVAASLDESPGELVHLANLNPHESALALMEGFFPDPTESRVVTAATPAEDYTPEERSKNAAEQPRDKNGRFATVGARGAMKSGTPGEIRGINPANGYLLIQADDGSTYSIPSSDFEIKDAVIPPRDLPNVPGTPGATPGEPPPPPPKLDLSKILAQPRALPNSTKAVLDRSLPPLNPAQLRQITEDYNAYIAEERRQNAKKFQPVRADGGAGLDETAMNPDTADVKPIYLAIVDQDDPLAVLELVAMSPASSTSNQATTFRRVNGQWIRDDAVLQDLKSPTPPPVVMLDANDYKSVLEQVDQSSPVTASVQYFIGANNELWQFVAAGEGIRAGAAERLRQYWSTGKGGLKIRWNTPGDWTRCNKHLRKYLGTRAKGYCANLHHRNTGMWPGDRRNRTGSN